MASFPHMAGIQAQQTEVTATLKWEMRMCFQHPLASPTTGHWSFLHPPFCLWSKWLPKENIKTQTSSTPTVVTQIIRFDHLKFRVPIKNIPHGESEMNVSSKISVSLTWFSSFPHLRHFCWHQLLSPGISLGLGSFPFSSSLAALAGPLLAHRIAPMSSPRGTAKGHPFLAQLGTLPCQAASSHHLLPWGSFQRKSPYVLHAQET